MKHFWRVGLAVLVALAAFSRGTTANAQGGAAGTTQGGGTADNPQQGQNPGGGLIQPGQDESGFDDSNARTLPPSPRSGLFGRVTSTQRQVVNASPPGGVARSGGAGAMTQNGQTRPFAARAGRASGAPTASPVPEGSSWQQTRRPASPPSSTVRSTTHNYYPTLRPSLGPNANAPPRTQVRRGRAGAGAGSGVGVTNSMMGGGAQGAQPVPGSRPLPVAARQPVGGRAKRPSALFSGPEERRWVAGARVDEPIGPHPALVQCLARVDAGDMYRGLAETVHFDNHWA